jgi:hypothetical protein
MRPGDIGVFQKKGRVPLLMLLVTLSSSPAVAQRDLTGHWSPLPRNQDGSESGQGTAGDYAGLPINTSGRWKAQSWNPGEFDIAEWVCRPHSWEYAMQAVPSELRLSEEVDKTTQRVIAYQGYIWYYARETTIWMDGRPHPPTYAPHTWSGFSTGEWTGNTLVETTTHLKESYIRRNGVPRSDQATVRTRWKRFGDYLLATTIIYDPIYLAEPYIRTAIWVSNPALVILPFNCDEATAASVPRGTVPHYLPGQNPQLTDFATEYGVPLEAAMGGPETMYPEYIAKMRTMKTLPRPAGKAPAESTERAQ